MTTTTSAMQKEKNASKTLGVAQRDQQRLIWLQYKRRLYILYVYFY